jgi:3-methylfumaryl-CoA hydratase
MSAGAQITFIRPLCVGDAIQRTSRIIDVSAKQGSAGSLVFVRVRHEISNAGGLAVIDEQNIVYRERRPVGARERSSIPQVMEHDWMREIRPDALLLFRYSALTFNAHRIHYDQRYVREVEQYPRLVVHGPLIATLLLDLLRSQIPNAEVSKFTFRVIKPTYDGAILQLYGKCAGQAVQLWATHRNGDLAMQATAELARAV